MTIKCGRLPTNENTFKHISVSALSWALQGELLFSGDSLPNHGESHSQQDVPRGSRGPSQSQRKGAGLGFHSAENMSAALSHALSAWSQAVFSEASRNGDI